MSVKRHIAKTISWRLLGSFDTFIIVFLITDNISYSYNMLILEFFIKSFMYFFHERLWIRVKINLSIKRHIFKTFSWRLIAVLTTLLISLIITNDIKIGTQITLIETLSKMILYFIHERIWYKTKFGLKNG